MNRAKTEIMTGEIIFWCFIWFTIACILFLMNIDHINEWLEKRNYNFEEEVNKLLREQRGHGFFRHKERNGFYLSDTQRHPFMHEHIMQNNMNLLTYDTGSYQIYDMLDNRVWPKYAIVYRKSDKRLFRVGETDGNWFKDDGEKFPCNDDNKWRNMDDYTLYEYDLVLQDYKNRALGLERTHLQ